MKKVFFLSAFSYFFSADAQNVGIGTNTPDVKLHLRDSVTAFANLLKLQNASSYITFYDNNNTYKSYIWDNGTQLQIGTAPAGSSVSIAPNFIPSANFLSNGTVGIGTATPSEKLDVNGNINLNGSLRINNTAGQANQVLMTNNSGNTVWGNMCQFTNEVAFAPTISPFTEWIVPANVTKICIEAWGGGGGGASGGGGNAAYYAKKYIDVVPNDVIKMVIGRGGNGASLETGNGADGSNTEIFKNNAGLLTAASGTGATPNGPALIQPSFLGGESIIGEAGQPNTETYQQRSAGEFVTCRKYGDGGRPYPFSTGAGVGAFLSFNSVSLATIVLRNGNIGTAPGAGGGGGPHQLGSSGSNGRNGRVIIHY